MSSMVGHVVVIPPAGSVSLTANKLTPVCDQSEAQQALPLAYTLGRTDVSAFKDFLRALPAEAWEDEKAEEENVKLVRPAHDAWGIKKIVFTFCDDFLQKVFDLPYSRQEVWRAFLAPIYAAAGITDESRIVRSLLASMPPGALIPVHHDTGYWVKHTHRVHVAIDSSSNQVDFLVGPTVDRMQKMSFDEGRIVELNNQAKHAVTNNWDRNRVHLIFDYVDDHPIMRRYSLNPGDQVRQTRRTIDLACEEGQGRPAPSFVILGAQKSGTTSMYEYICSHPLVLKGRRRETHYFDWRWNKSLPEDDSQQHAAFFLNFFDADALKKHPSLITGESTPSYLLHSDVVISRLRRVCPWARLIVMLRNPVDRAYSQYQMSLDTSGTPEQMRMRGMSQYSGRQFSDIVEEEITRLLAMGITPECEYDAFRDKVLTPIRETAHGGHSVIARGLYALQLLPWLEAFGGQLRVLSIGEIKGGRAKVQATIDKVFAFVGIPPHELDEAQLGAKNTRDASERMDAETRARLERFYSPFNARLFALIGRDLSEDW